MTMTEDYSVPCQSVEEALQRKFIILRPRVSKAEIQKRMDDHVPMIQLLYKELGKFIMFAAGYGTEEAFEKMMDEATYLVKQFCIAEWEHQFGPQLKAGMAKIDVESRVTAATAAAEKSVKGNKKPAQQKTYNNMAADSRALGPLVPSAPSTVPPAAPSVSLPQSQPSAVPQRSNAQQLQSPMVMNQASSVPHGRVQLPPTPQSAAAAQQSPAHIMSPSPAHVMTLTATIAQSGARMFPQSPIPQAQQRPGVQQMQDLARLREMANNAQQLSQRQPPQTVKPQQLQKQHVIPMQSQMVGNTQQLQAQRQPLLFPPQHQQQVWQWIQGQYGPLAPTPQQQQWVAKAQQTRQHMANLNALPSRTPPQQEGLAALQLQYKQAFMTLCRSMSTMNGSEQSIRSTTPNATPSKKRFAPAEIETPSPTKKQMIVVACHPNGSELRVEDLGNGQVRGGDGQIIKLEQFRQMAVRKGFNFGPHPAQEGFNTPALREALVNKGYPGTAKLFSEME
jgi:hypothetical protein